jgi:membrane-associated protease RseP (regulator of RpoE activity)
VTFDDKRKTPVVPLHLGDRSVLALVDSGSDAGFSLNPAGLDLSFAQPPRTGGMVGTISGDQPQRVARLAASVTLGEQVFAEPLVELSDELSAIGGGVLKFFSVTFDQLHDRMLLQRDTRAPIRMAARRSAGLSFSKAAAYWRVAGVVPDSPAAAAGVQAGDLVTRINGEPVAKWDLRRFEQLVTGADEIVFSFLNGNVETEKRIGVFALVP